MELGLLDGGEGGEHNANVFVEISKIMIKTCLLWQHAWTPREQCLASRVAILFSVISWLVTWFHNPHFRLLKTSMTTIDSCQICETGQYFCQQFCCEVQNDVNVADRIVIILSGRCWLHSSVLFVYISMFLLDIVIADRFVILFDVIYSSLYQYWYHYSFGCYQFHDAFDHMACHIPDFAHHVWKPEEVLVCMLTSHVDGQHLSIQSLLY